MPCARVHLHTVPNASRLLLRAIPTTASDDEVARAPLSTVSTVLLLPEVVLSVGRRRLGGTAITFPSKEVASDSGSCLPETDAAHCMKYSNLAWWGGGEGGRGFARKFAQI